MMRLPAKKISLKLWEGRKPVVDYIRGGNNNNTDDDSEEESSYNNTDDNTKEKSSYNSDGDSYNNDGDRFFNDNDGDMFFNDNDGDRIFNDNDGDRFFDDSEEDVGGDNSNSDLEVQREHNSNNDSEVQVENTEPAPQSENNKNMNTPIRNNSVENSSFRSSRTPGYKRITELIRMTDGPSFHVEGFRVWEKSGEGCLKIGDERIFLVILTFGMVYSSSRRGREYSNSMALLTVISGKNERRKSHNHRSFPSPKWNRHKTIVPSRALFLVYEASFALLSASVIAAASALLIDIYEISGFGLKTRRLGFKQVDQGEGHVKRSKVRQQEGRCRYGGRKSGICCK
ncbi:hypothetical protein L1887_16001 [Cichorium endivia]|nr:hypothetical protein L1887_16001 [Cichorium endivia]